MSKPAGIAAFVPAEHPVVRERIDARRRHVGVVRQVAGAVEPGVRIAALVPAEQIVVLQRVDAGRRNVRIVPEVVLRVEVAGDRADRRIDRAPFRPTKGEIVRQGFMPMAATSGLWIG